ncbi:MAG TPA: DNA polymerase III subunit delta' [Pirellulales bacterium]|nr:DNA polymerase III subunit delta' [Pirellulales bacterium]
MSWQGIEGHDGVVQQFRLALERDRLASTFLFVGPPGIGKRAFALRLAKSLLCSRRPAAQLDPCGECPACQQVRALTHPDLMLVAKPAEKSFLPVELFIGTRDHRMQAGLCHDIRLKPMMGGRRVAIIDDADHLNEEGANCLLKTLEEPPPKSVMILIGTSAERQLPTIRSRSQIVRFRPLEPAVVARLLLESGETDDQAAARRVAEHCGGSVQKASELLDPQLWSFRDDLLRRLGDLPLDTARLAPMLLAFIEAAGKEAPARRRRTRQVLDFVVEFYRAVVRQVLGLPPTSDAALEHAAGQAAAGFEHRALAATACVQRTLDALGHIERNANQTTLVEAWLDDLSQIIAHDRPVLSG